MFCVNNFSIFSGDFFKICLNVIEDKPGQNPKKRKRRRKYLDSSVKKLFILAIVKGVPETRDNVNAILTALNLKKLRFDFCLATDLKLQNIAVGIQSGSSTYP